MYHVNAQGMNEHMISYVRYYYYINFFSFIFFYFLFSQ